MNATMLSRHCQSAHSCRHPVCFEARLEARSAATPIRKTAELCAQHLGDVVHELADWAYQRGVTDGLVTVLIVDTAWDQLTSLAAGSRRCGGELPFGTISLEPL